MMKTYLFVARNHVLFFLWKPFSGESYTKAWEVNILCGGHVNMSCVIFHAHQDIIVSNYEGKIICIWDISKHIVVQTFQMKHD